LLLLFVELGNDFISASNFIIEVANDMVSVGLLLLKLLNG